MTGISTYAWLLLGDALQAFGFGKWVVPLALPFMADRLLAPQFRLQQLAYPGCLARSNRSVLVIDYSSHIT